MPVIASRTSRPPTSIGCPTILARNGETESGGRLIERVLAGDGTECGSLRVKGK